MAQRLMVARAIMHRPPILFLDEPTAGLDPQSRIALWEILGELHADGQTILLTTHYMEEADQLCDRVAIIDHGASSPSTRRPSSSARSAPTPSSRVTADGDLDALGRRCSTPRSPARTDADASSTAPSLLGVQRRRAACCPRSCSVAERHGFDVTDLSVTEPTLETVFINLTGKDLRE